MELDIPEEDVVLHTPYSAVDTHDELFSTAEFADIIGYLEDCKRELENRDNYYDPGQIEYLGGLIERLERLYDHPATCGYTVLMRRINIHERQ